MSLTLEEINKIIIDKISEDRPSNKDYKEYLREAFKLCRDTINQLSDISIARELPNDFDKNS